MAEPHVDAPRVNHETERNQFRLASPIARDRLGAFANAPVQCDPVGGGRSPSGKSGATA